MTRPARSSIVRALDSVGVGVSKKTPSRVKGLPLASRGAVIETYDDDTYAVCGGCGHTSRGKVA